MYWLITLSIWSTMAIINHYSLNKHSDWQRMKNEDAGPLSGLAWDIAVEVILFVFAPVLCFYLLLDKISEARYKMKVYFFSKRAKRLLRRIQHAKK